MSEKDAQFPRPIHALVADDEAHVRLYLKHLLERLDITDVVLTADGEAAAAAAADDDRFDIILLDISMPGTNGIEALARIRPLQPQAIIVMLTALGTRATVEKAFSLGADHYLRKDQSASDCESRLREMIQTLDLNPHDL